MGGGKGHFFLKGEIINCVIRVIIDTNDEWF